MALFCPPAFSASLHGLTLHSPEAMCSPGTVQKSHLVAAWVGFMVHVPSMTSLECIPSMTAQCISILAAHPGVPSAGTGSGAVP